MTTLDPVGVDQAGRLRAMVAQHASVRTPEPASAATGVVLAVCSGKGGVGKTTFAVNAAVSLARTGVRVVLVDLDIGVANADVLLGMTPRTRLTRRSLAEGTFADVAVPTPFGFSLVAGVSGGSSAARLGRAELDGVLDGLDDLRSSFDLVLVDTGAGVGVESVTIGATADLAVVVTTPEPASIADAYAAHKCIAYGSRDATGAPVPSACLVVNAADRERDALAAAERIDLTSRRFLGGGIPCMGWIRRDRRISKAARSRVPVAAEAPICRVSRDIAACARSVWSACSVRRAEVGRERAEVGRAVTR